MAFNPADIFKFRQRLSIFNEQHPRVMPFMQAAAGKIAEGAVIEVTVTSPAGESITSNIKITADDLETIAMLQSAGAEN